MSLGYRTRAGSCGRKLMHGHCAPCLPGRTVLRRRHLLLLARWWPSAAGLTGPRIGTLSAPQPCALHAGCFRGTRWGGGGGALPMAPSGGDAHTHRGGAGGCDGVPPPVACSGRCSNVVPSRLGGLAWGIPTVKGPVWPLGRQPCWVLGHPGLGGAGSFSHGAVGVRCVALGGAAVTWTRAHRPGGTGSPAQGVVGVPCGARGGGSCLQEPGTPAWGDGESCLGGGWSILYGPRGGSRPREPGTPARGGGGGGDGEFCPRGGRRVPQGPWGCCRHQEPGTPV